MAVLSTQLPPDDSHHLRKTCSSFDWLTTSTNTYQLVKTCILGIGYSLISETFCLRIRGKITCCSNIAFSRTSLVDDVFTTQLGQALYRRFYGIRKYFAVRL